MSARRLRDRILRRAHHAGLDVNSPLLENLETYYSELARWNRRLNLTALPLEGEGADQAMDRLLIEPVLTAKLIAPSAHRLMDIGSGGGSPAIPIKLARRDLQLTMVEVKVRKCAFLRQVARRLALTDANVENSRFEELLARPDMHESFDVMTVRAVRLEPTVWNGLQAFVRPGGQIINLAASPETAGVPPPLFRVAAHALPLPVRTYAVVVEKRALPLSST
ncbi:MAG: 16S rRNA (guanine(527)-N(7))-methyltransferase RsmG [Vicinamibacterales bacterium]